MARASSVDVFEKLYKAGANRVVSPYHSTGQKMAAMLLKPLVHEYLDSMAYGADLEIMLEELELPKDCGQDHRRLCNPEEDRDHDPCHQEGGRTSSDQP